MQKLTENLAISAVIIIVTLSGGFFFGRIIENHSLCLNLHKNFNETYEDLYKWNVCKGDYVGQQMAWGNDPLSKDR